MFFSNATLFYNLFWILILSLLMFILCHYIIILLFSVHYEVFLYRVCNCGQKTHVSYPLPNVGVLQALSCICIPTKVFRFTPTTLDLSQKAEKQWVCSYQSTRHFNSPRPIFTLIFWFSIPLSYQTQWPQLGEVCRDSRVMYNVRSLISKEDKRKESIN